MLGTVAAAATGAGVWIAGRVRGDRPAAIELSLPADFWTLQFEQPQGGMLRFADLRGKPLLLNFWATWCPPCVDELPLLNRFHASKGANGWQVVGLAVDQPSAVRAFLQRLPLRFPVGFAGLGGSELSRSLGNLSGGLPFTVVLGADSRPLARRMGRVTENDLEKWAQASA